MRFNRPVLAFHLYKMPSEKHFMPPLRNGSQNGGLRRRKEVMIEVVPDVIFLLFAQFYAYLLKGST